MNIGQAITLLQAKANELPTGYDTEIRVSMCDGEGIEMTRVLEIDHMATVSRETGQATELFAVIQGHPHNDDHAFRAKGIAHQADEYLHRWSAEGHEPDGHS
ncbi:hypothetical protein FKR81_37340 [Lentzea tibetensis]|uniref:Uncharacterized protein n=1 Tax=Lentzea tibetensis TaxID=2591470 RepID=A0A563EI95_9PSEU|nr:hypothetical protein [Lentzea tibetensis]TWP46040.1 hypothetical protein FKR81_37340 [Lentzea tibetensis]